MPVTFFFTPLDLVREIFVNRSIKKTRAYCSTKSPKHGATASPYHQDLPITKTRPCTRARGGLRQRGRWCTISSETGQRRVPCSPVYMANERAYKGQEVGRGPRLDRPGGSLHGPPLLEPAAPFFFLAALGYYYLSEPLPPRLRGASCLLRYWSRIRYRTCVLRVEPVTNLFFWWCACECRLFARATAACLPLLCAGCTCVPAVREPLTRMQCRQSKWQQPLGTSHRREPESLDGGGPGLVEGGRSLRNAARLLETDALARTVRVSSEPRSLECKPANRPLGPSDLTISRRICEGGFVCGGVPLAVSKAVGETQRGSHLDGPA